MYVSIAELPSCVQMLLSRHGYRRKDIEIVPRKTVSLCGGGSDGQRAFVILVNLATKKAETHVGSWGGANMFNPGNRVDLDTKSYDLPINGLVIKGSEGHRCYARIYIHPDNLPQYLTTAVDVGSDEREILKAYYGLRSGLYRRQAIEAVGNHEQVIARLVDRALLKQSRNGATQITTEGKNALRAA